MFDLQTIDKLLKTAEKQNELISIINRLKAARQKCIASGQTECLQLIDAAMLDAQSKANAITSEAIQDMMRGF